MIPLSCRSNLAGQYLLVHFLPVKKKTKMRVYIAGEEEGMLELGRTNETTAKKCRTLSLLVYRNLIYVVSTSCKYVTYSVMSRTLLYQTLF